MQSGPKQAPTKSSQFVKTSNASSVKWSSLREKEDSNWGESGHFLDNAEFRSQSPIHLPAHYLWVPHVLVFCAERWLLSLCSQLREPHNSPDAAMPRVASRLVSAVILTVLGAPP